MVYLSTMKAKNRKPVVYYPLFLNIQGKKSVVVGGGKVAIRKIEKLLECGAKVTVVSPTLHQDLTRFVKNKTIRLIKREYELGDLNGAAIVIAAADAEEINQRVAEEAKNRGVLVNVVDSPERSNHIIPSFFRRGGLTIAVSTGGVSPALAKKIRAKLEKSFGVEYASLLSLIGEVRSGIKREGYILDAETWQDILDIDLLIRLLKAGALEKAKTILLEKLRASKRGNRSTLKVIKERSWLT
jgi:precorrin-2 dehydrogenase/sirohydrochlorin ferrochelatase